MTLPIVDPQLCPLCGELNQCALAKGGSTCWCFDITTSQDTVSRIPKELQGEVCICRGCATGQRDPELIRREMQKLLRHR